MKVVTRVFPDGQTELEIVGESEHENSLIKLISQKSFDGAYISETGGTSEPTRTHMIISYKNSESKVSERKSTDVAKQINSPE